MSRRRLVRAGALSLLASAICWTAASARVRPGGDDMSELKDRVTTLEENLRKQLTGSPPNVPIGTILPYAGLIDAAHPLPEGWRLCNGAALKAGEYEELWKKLRAPQGGGFVGAWGGNGSPEFNLPDLRGRFLRGVDLGANLDAGRALGTPQGDSFRSHNHAGSGVTTGSPLSIRSRSASELKDGFASGGAFGDGGASGVSRAPIGIQVTVESAGGNETRPVNSAVNWIIRVK